MSGSDERAREVDIHETMRLVEYDMTNRRRDGDGFVGERKEVATIITALRAALAASRPTDADTLTAAVNQNDAMRQELANVGNLVSNLAGKLGVDQANSDGSWPDLAGRVQRLIDATPKPPVDEEARWPIERPASADIDVSGTAAIGISAADIDSADDWLVRNLTGDGAGA